MKTKGSNITVRELFRRKLEFAEVTPDAALKSKLMRRVARQEFLHFNPASFNIFYLGAILGTALTAGIILLTGSHNLNHVSQSPSGRSSDTSYYKVSVEQPIVVKPDNSMSAKSVAKELTTSEEFKPGNQIPKDTQLTRRNIPVPGAIKDAFSGKSVFKEDTSGRKLVKATGDAFLIDPQISAGCAPFKVHFHNTAVSYDSCRWTFGDGGNSNQKDPEWIFDVEGDYRISLKVYDHGKLLLSSSVVTVHSTPKAHFEISPAKAILPNDEIRFLNYSTNAVRYNWDFGDGFTSDFFEPNHTYLKLGKYNVRLVVYTEWGCSDSLTVMNAFSGSEYFIDFPNAFIPNRQGPSGGYYSTKSDEAAQVFHPSFSGVTEFQLKIFSKLGIPIYESNDVNLGWDGYNKGQLCDPGVYIWKVRGKFRNGVPFIQMGDVTLLNN